MEKKVKKSGNELIRHFEKVSKNFSEEGVEHLQENIVDRLSHARHVRLLIIEWVLLVAAITFFAITQAYWYTDSYATTTYTNGGTYTEATLGKINSLNPLFASTNSEKTLSKLLFSSIASVDYSGHTGLDLAKSITYDNNAKIYKVVLKDDLKWSDGAELNADDVIFTTTLLKSPVINSSYSSNLTGVSVKKIDQKTIEFSLKSPNVYFATNLDFPILPEHILRDVSPKLLLENSFSAAPTGSGPFSYNASQAIETDGEETVYLVPNTNYHKGSPKLDSFAVHAYVKTDDIISALNSGSVTASAEITSSDIDKITSTSLSEHDSLLNYGVFAFINMKSELLSSKNLRKAMQQGIDMSTVRSALHNESELNYPILSNQLGSDATFPQMPAYNKDAAKAEIKKYSEENTDKKLELNIVTVKSGNLPEIADKIGEQVKDLGFTPNVTVYEADQDFTLNILASRNYDILVYEIGLGPDPDVYAYYHASEATSTGHNLSSYESTVASDLLLSARSTTNQTLRQKKYEKFLEKWVEDVPALGICQTSLNYFVNSNVRSFSTENRLVYANDRFSDITNWAAKSIVKNRTP